MNTGFVWFVSVKELDKHYSETEIFMLGAAACLLRVGTRDAALLMALRMHAAASCIHLMLVHGGRLVCESLIISQ